MVIAGRFCKMNIKVVCCIYLLTLLTYASIEPKSVDPGLTCLLERYLKLQQMTKQTIFVEIDPLWVMLTTSILLTPRHIDLYCDSSNILWSRNYTL